MYLLLFMILQKKLSVFIEYDIFCEFFIYWFCYVDVVALYSLWGFLVLFIYLFIYCFLGLHAWHVEVPRLGIESAYTTATATWDPSRICDLYHSSWQRQIPNPLNEARDQTCIRMDTSQIHFHCATRALLFLGFFECFYYENVLNFIKCFFLHQLS